MDAPHPFWTLRRLGDALGTPRLADRPLRGISTDTRTLAPGDAFVALRGARFDAHDLLAEAVRAGAAALVVADGARAAGLGVPVVVVADTVDALGRLAAAWRVAWGGTVVAVGGSNGKTTTKDLLASALAAALPTHATIGNLNNRIGVPLTLLATPATAAVAVVEMGTDHPGELALLRDLARPDVAVITTVQEEHLAGFGDLAGVLAEEASLAEGVALAIVPADEPALVAAVAQRAARVRTAGLGTGDLAAAAWGLDDRARGWCTVGAERLTVPVPGAHNLRNALLALAAAEACGVERSVAVRGLATAPPPPMRAEVRPLGRALLVDDTYNSNPGSARAALALLADAGGARPRVVVLGTMRELGAATPAQHEAIARAALASGAALVAGLGDFAAPLAASGDPRVVVADDVDALWAALAPRLPGDAAILLKASRGVRLERLVPRLEAWAAGAG